MKKVIKIFTVIIIVIILMLAVLQLWIYLDHTKSKKKLVVVKCYYESFYAVDENGELYDVSFDNPRKLNGEKLKMGQEVEVYWHGMINLTAPAGIGGVRKCKILKEKSDIEIPEYAIQHCYNTPKNVMIHVREISNEKMEFRILDTNEIPYKYDFDYNLFKKNIENEEYNRKIVETNKKEQQEKSTTQKDKDIVTVTNTIEPFNPDVKEYKTIWERVNQKRIVPIEDVIKIIDSTSGHFDVEGKLNWNDIYGVLEPGEYQLVLKNKEDMIHFNSIVFNFVVEENGKAICEVPTFEW